jgi:hypothetical protein
VLSLNNYRNEASGLRKAGNSRSDELSALKGNRSSFLNYESSGRFTLSFLS